MAWKMQMCLAHNKPLLEKVFETFEDGKDWLRQNHPGILARGVWKSVDGPDFRQFGTGYYWASFERVK